MAGSRFVRDVASPAGGAPLRVLVADDDPASRRFFCDGLQALGASASACADGIAALERACREAFDLLLLDCRMPGRGAVDVLSALRATAAAASVASPAVATTAECSPLQRGQLREAGFCDVLDKPCGLGELQRVLLLARMRGPHAPLLDDEAGLATSGDRKVMHALRALLHEELATLDRELDRLALDPPQLVERLHRLRSSCGFCGALALSGHVVDLQGQLGRGGTGLPSLDRFRQAVLTTLDALAAERA